MANSAVYINLGSKAFKPFLTKNIQVRFQAEEKVASYYPFKNGEVYTFLGEVKNAPGHGVFLDHKGKMHNMYHLDNFWVLLEVNVRKVDEPPLDTFYLDDMDYVDLVPSDEDEKTDASPLTKEALEVICNSDND
jgi:hypothetical protein